MKKVIIILISVLVISGCNKETPTSVVKEYLTSYNDLNSKVINSMTKSVDKENLTTEQKTVYKEILKKQYHSLAYEIINEKDSSVYVKITVNDLYKAQNDASNYLKEHIDEFYDEKGNYNPVLYMDYKLKMMENAKDRVTYDLTFKVDKNKDGYEVIQPSDIDLKKIHGIYNYDID